MTPTYACANRGTLDSFVEQQVAAVGASSAESSAASRGCPLKSAAIQDSRGRSDSQREVGLTVASSRSLKDRTHWPTDCQEKRFTTTKLRPQSAASYPHRRRSSAPGPDELLGAAGRTAATLSRTVITEPEGPTCSRRRQHPSARMLATGAQPANGAGDTRSASSISAPMTRWSRSRRACRGEAER